MRIMTSLTCAVLTISDTRSKADDTSGDLLVELLGAAGHRLASRAIERDDIYQIRATVSAWIADEAIQVVLTTGGTGFTGRDSTPEALTPLFDKTIDGFGELFRQLSYDEIGSSSLISTSPTVIGAISSRKLPDLAACCARSTDCVAKASMASRVN